MKEPTGFFTNKGYMIHEGDIVVWKINRFRLDYDGKHFVNLKQYMPLIVRYLKTEELFTFKIAQQEEKPYRHHLKDALHANGLCNGRYYESYSWEIMGSVYDDRFEEWIIDIQDRKEEVRKSNNEVEESLVKEQQVRAASRPKTIWEEIKGLFS